MKYRIGYLSRLKIPQSYFTSQNRNMLEQYICTTQCMIYNRHGCTVILRVEWFGVGIEWMRMLGDAGTKQEYIFIPLPSIHHTIQPGSFIHSPQHWVFSKFHNHHWNFDQPTFNSPFPCKHGLIQPTTKHIISTIKQATPKCPIAVQLCGQSDSQ